jgi:hypothetical protein
MSGGGVIERLTLPEEGAQALALAPCAYDLHCRGIEGDGSEGSDGFTAAYATRIGFQPERLL